MKKAFFKTILKIIGWKCGPIGENVPKCVVCVAPHTSNWDFLLGEVFYSSLGRKAAFLIKKDWFIFPLNYLFKWLGGVPVDRGKRTSITEQMVEEFNKRDSFHLGVTPEGTRKKVKEWKKGFYQIALQANVPILVVYFDYAKKEAGVKAVFYPTGDMTKDIQTIKEMYRGVTAKHPEKFYIG